MAGSVQPTAVGTQPTGVWCFTDAGWPMTNGSYSPAGALWRFDCTKPAVLFFLVLKTALTHAVALLSPDLVAGPRVGPHVRGGRKKVCMHRGGGGAMSPLKEGGRAGAWERGSRDRPVPGT